VELFQLLACALIEQGRWRNFQGFGDLINDRDGRIADTAFNSADVSAMHVALERELFLRESGLVAKALQILAHKLADIHANSRR